MEENKVNPSDFSKSDAIKKSPKLFIILISIFLIISSIILIIVLVIFGAFQCSVTSCDKNAYCINGVFHADCQCNIGYSGNGFECDECSTFQNNVINSYLTSQTAEPNSWPATVDILFNYVTSYKIDSEEYLVMGTGNCGGTLINRKTVLTTASCIKKTFTAIVKNQTRTIPVELNSYHANIESMYSVFVGVYNQISYMINIGQAKHVHVEKIIKHEQYDENTDDNDIAIIRLKERLELNEMVQLSCLPNKNENIDSYPNRHQLAWGAGWGSSFSGGKGGSGQSYFGSRPLKSYRLDIYNNSMCLPVAKQSLDQLNNDVFCAGEVNVSLTGGKRGNCHGDYGSSLYVRENVTGVEKFVTAGLLSYNEGCNIPYSPGLYTNVVRYLDWIRMNSKY
ncbi:unnamed protein product [Brachionus calyciflorus]|uniref:Uncharacterized protein n=1 Tax=Brachionus calyciflorus TaxID=104777 RepID=A0A813XFC8_9BILA|nr:unnamed protein product [Brachionus calyciflorus]